MSTHDRAVRTFGEVLDKVRENYIVPKDEMALADAALKNLLSSLDGHSGYMTAQEYRAFDEGAKASFGGIGVVIEAANGRLRVLSPVDGSPALRAGVAADWEILSIDGAATHGFTLADATAKLHGEPGTIVSVAFGKPNGEVVTLKLAREIIHIQSVYQRRVGAFGYMRITGFTQASAADFATQAKVLLNAGPVNGLVLDLRNNGGGFIDAAVAIASHFLKAGAVIVRTGKSLASATPIVAASSDATLASLPIVILINGGSASAAEIVAAALHDNHRAALVGLTSFGKGLVQTIFPLDGGKDGAASVTTARYYTPAGQSIHQIGIAPDLIVARTAGEAAEAVGPAQTFSEATLPHALDNDLGLKRLSVDAVEGPAAIGAGPVVDTPLFVRSLPNDGDIAADFQLQRALDVLRLGSVAAARADRPARVYVRQHETPTLAAPKGP